MEETCACCSPSDAPLQLKTRENARPIKRSHEVGSLWPAIGGVSRKFELYFDVFTSNEQFYSKKICKKPACPPWNLKWLLLWSPRKQNRPNSDFTTIPAGKFSPTTKTNVSKINKLHDISNKVSKHPFFLVWQWLQLELATYDALELYDSKKMFLSKTTTWDKFVHGAMESICTNRNSKRG